MRRSLRERFAEEHRAREEGEGGQHSLPVLSQRLQLIRQKKAEYIEQLAALRVRAQALPRILGR